MAKRKVDNTAIDALMKKINKIAEVQIVPAHAKLWKMLDKARKEDAAGRCEIVDNPFQAPKRVRGRKKRKR